MIRKTIGYNGLLTIFSNTPSWPGFGFADHYPYEKWLAIIKNIKPTFSDKPIAIHKVNWPLGCPAMQPPMRHGRPCCDPWCPGDVAAREVWPPPWRATPGWCSPTSGSVSWEENMGGNKTRYTKNMSQNIFCKGLSHDVYMTHREFKQ